MENEPQTMAEKGQSNAARVWQTIGDLELANGSPRQIADGGLLGISIAVLIALLSIQCIDAYLNTALMAFVIAIPVLAFGFLCTFYKRPKIVPHAGPSNIFAAWLVGAWITEGIGWVASYVGICSVIGHMSIPALIAFVSTSVFVVLILPFLSSIGLVIYGVRVFKKQEPAPAKEIKTPPTTQP